jgi:hypothetical protein
LDWNLGVVWVETAFDTLDGLALPTRFGLVETGITGAHGLNGVWKALYRVYKDSGYRVGNPRINEKCQLTATFNI